MKTDKEMKKAVKNKITKKAGKETRKTKKRLERKNCEAITFELVKHLQKKKTGRPRLA